MNAKVETTGSAMDSVKLFLALLILVGAVMAFYYYSDESQLYRVLGMVVAVGAALYVASLTAKGRGAMGFARDSRNEVRKVVWPTRAETLQTTLMVFVMVIIVAIFVWLLDMLLVEAVKVLTGQGG
ncbi:MAG TPA: preprotein translocase subunit SecE [Chromatiaceae bacterium]|jgi:preprotein translocase subunit SecE|nr:preprotein translocase subunit SecE [Chromatiaceae bacterium]HIA07747.1 preprotein translocase subunit SecE [Chromatiaceae bacterium]HIB85504.1 preprotein translocase subunit SecE [Chromatiaceae bacterium]HIN82792.1 preprotein translocase subunit SecE [Chromatiales bacterium]HIO55341.1 preprotein translocase subunit SecE [Chromatiales bacterium]